MLSKDPHVPLPYHVRPPGSEHLETWPGVCGNLGHTDRKQHSGVGEVWANNTCVTMSVGPPLELECDVEGNAVMLATSGNTYRTPTAEMVFGCAPGAPTEPNQTRTAPPNSTNQPLASWQTRKNWDGTQREGGSRVIHLPTDAELVAAAHSLLGFGGGALRLKTLDEQFAAGIARPALPTMGWRSWNWFACDIDQEIMERQAEAMVATPPWADKSLLQLGYSTIGLDDCYQSCTGPDGSFHDPEANGAPIINRSKFPSLSDMTAKARALGLRPGFYGDNCHCHQGEKKAGVTHYVQDVALTLAAGFEGTKIDSCGNQRDMSVYAAQFALRNSSMLVESCGNGPPGSNPKNDFPPHPSYLRMLETTCPMSFYRVSVDLAPQFLSCVYNLNRALPFLDAEAPLSRPGCWAYADMSMVGVDVPRHSDQPHYDNDTMTWIEWRSHFA